MGGSVTVAAQGERLRPRGGACEVDDHRQGRPRAHLRARCLCRSPGLHGLWLASSSSPSAVSQGQHRFVLIAGVLGSIIASEGRGGQRDGSVDGNGTDEGEYVGGIRSGATMAIGDNTLAHRLLGPVVDSTSAHGWFHGPPTSRGVHGTRGGVLVRM